MYRAGELGEEAREIVAAARSGMARVEDTDGTSLVVMPEARLAVLTDLVRCASQHLVIESVLRLPPADRSPASHGEHPWLQVFDDDDLSTFATELGDALLVAAGGGSTADLNRLVADWRVTAEVLADRASRDVLLGAHEPGDLLEVTRPS